MLIKFFCSLSLLVVATALTSFQPALQQDQQPAVLRTIIVDAGHGGKAIGARGKYSTEKDVCLAIALKLGKKIAHDLPGVKVVYTRTTDAFVDNRVRAEMANAARGDLFISIHANSARQLSQRKITGYRKETYYTGKGKNRKKKTRSVPIYKTYTSENPARGTETYIWAADRTDAKGGFVNEVMSEEEESEEGFSPDLNDPAFKAKSLLWTKRYFDKSLLLANLVEEEFVKGGRSSRGVKQRNNEGIWVLQATGMPSILIETGFISNRKEEDYLNNKVGQEEMASQILKAVKRYKTALGDK
ncbi:MAG: N-acetylmuramoyl-L-alanine amidase [Candidatus Pseudobacter hemicellulosilyticus]|uniref:N-acetylmuramoyl-L-alanine amidase n=1 Tax=Candidatus Pseudobacter hemicellulosilyticus TaxID=3121375 RepID=A0AAJ5WUN2_9BACT|nr:MAG: N-acetylmuramoyl-L-alanine amidase [Pseudobacter sp.]